MIFGIYDNWAEVIFKKLYDVRVPVISTYSMDELEVVGIPVNTDGEKKMDSTYQEIRVKITIIDMIEKFTNGFSVSVIKHDDAIQIYEVINNHLLAWKNYKIKSLNQNLMPEDDLVVMDKFAQEIFDLNKISIVKNNQVKAPAYGVNFRNLLMSASEPVTRPVVDYDSIERTSNAPEVERKGKYDLNTLLMN